MRIARLNVDTKNNPANEYDHRIPPPPGQPGTGNVDEYLRMYCQATPDRAARLPAVTVVRKDLR